MKQLCVIPCGTKKIWSREPDIGAVKAKDAYIGTFHKLCRDYANHFIGDWVILSAKYGFLWPDDYVPGDYDVTFNKSSTEIMSDEDLKEQAIDKGLDRYNQIIVLTGKKYVPVIETVFSNKDCFIQFPLLECRGIGYMQQLLKEAVKTNKPIHLNQN